MPQHPRQGQTDLGFGWFVVILSAVEVRIAQNGVATDDVKSQRLTGQPRRSCNQTRCSDAMRKTHCPGQRLMAAQTATNYRVQFLNTQVIDQPRLDIHHVRQSDFGETGCVSPAGIGIDGIRPGRAATTAQDVGTNDKISVGIDGFTRPDDNIPPARRVVLIMPGNMRIARKRVADQNGVGGGVIQPAVGFIGDGHRRQLLTQLQLQRLVERECLQMQQRLKRAVGITAGKKISHGSSKSAQRRSTLFRSL